MSVDFTVIAGVAALVLAGSVSRLRESYTPMELVPWVAGLLVAGALAVIGMWEWKSLDARTRRKLRGRVKEIPESLRLSTPTAIRMGQEEDLRVSIFLPDSVRLRHTHIIGATGSGKTESVILNFLRQDVERGLGSIILDAKGDRSFCERLRSFVPREKLKIFDLSSASSLSYNPLLAGSALEAGQRLFSSFTWSEEYYRSKALSAVQRIFQNHSERQNRNPTIREVAEALESRDAYVQAASSKTYPEEVAGKDFSDLSGLRDQVNSLCLGHLAKILSPKRPRIRLENAAKGQVLYFRLQSLLSPQLAGILGRLLINHLNFLAGTAHRNGGAATSGKLIPTYLDEFAAFACPEFADLISMARSAGLALHFSHQSVGDLAEVPGGFLNRVTDNSATKIVMRINDPDTADFFARSFGTKLYKKVTQRVTNMGEAEEGDVVGEGTQREAHQFRASPDLLKTLPTGVGAVLIAHGQETPHGASSVFRVKFPRPE